MPSCEYCRHNIDNYDCEFFGDDIPDEFYKDYPKWSGCKMHPQELKKMSKIFDRMCVCGCMILGDEKAADEWSEYMRHLKEKYGGINNE